MKIIHEGKEIEVLPVEEVAAKEKEAAEKALTEFKTTSEKEAEELKSKLSKAEDDLKSALENAGSGSGQAERLRKERDEFKAQLQAKESDFNKKFEELSKQVKDVVGDPKTDLLEKLSGGDVELKKKIEFQFDKYDPTNNTKKGIEDRMKMAYQLATDSKPKPDFFSGGFSMGDRGDRGVPVKAGDITPNQKSIGNVLGITDEDRKNYEKYKSNK